MQDRKFPIGPFVLKEEYTPEEFQELLTIIENSPSDYQYITANLTSADLVKTYREGSWTVQQLVHHVADIQLLHYFRMKKALTETDYTTLTLISMDGWAATPDGKYAPLEDSLLLFEGVTGRYVYLAKSLGDEQLAIQYYHPVRHFWLNQKQALAMTAWHIQHHLAHIRLALQS
ncbi:MAG: DinB family protein [Siphonobacter sp.]